MKPAQKEILFLDSLFAKSVTGFTGQQYMPILRLPTQKEIWISSRSDDLYILFGHVPMTFACLITVAEFFLIFQYHKCNSPLKFSGQLLRRYVLGNGPRKLAKT